MLRDHRYIIRAETPDDEDAVHYITETAFAAVSHTSGKEAEIIRQLRKDGNLTLSFVAEGHGEIFGLVGRLHKVSNYSQLSRTEILRLVDEHVRVERLNPV